MENKKLQRTSVRAEAYLVLRDWIVEGKLKANQKLRDKELAEQLGVSRTPIREALLQLEREGFVQTKPNCSTIVSSIDFHNSLNLYSIVWTLENLALKQSFESITPKHLELMNNANERLLEAINAKHAIAAVEADNAFHSIYIQLSENTELCQIISELKQKLKRLEIFYFDRTKNALDSYEEHLRILEALQQKNLQLALQAIESNWQASFSRLQLN